MNAMPEYVLERVFDAPRSLVWKAWTDPALLPRWYGPNVETVVHAMDLAVGARWHIEMRWDGGARFERMDLLDIDPPTRLVWLQSMADADGAVAVSPQMPDWPRVLHTTITFEDRGEQTALKLVWTPHDASDAERAFFAQAISGADKGWRMGMEKLAQLLGDLQA